jgi:Fe-S-cluster containining protein
MVTQLAKRKKFSGEKLLNFRCTDCGNCCTDTIVPVTHLDLKRLMLGTKLKPSEIVEFYKSSEFADDGEGLHFVELDMGRRVMGLKKRFDEKEQKEGCKFYLDQRCTVYEHRPVTCRVWPFTLSLDDEGRRITKMEINDALPCPFELDGKNQPKDLIRNWKWDDNQDEEWEVSVKNWNLGHKGGSPEAFFKFLCLI